MVGFSSAPRVFCESESILESLPDYPPLIWLSCTRSVWHLANVPYFAVHFFVLQFGSLDAQSVLVTPFLDGVGRPVRSAGSGVLLAVLPIDFPKQSILFACLLYRLQCVAIPVLANLFEWPARPILFLRHDADLARPAAGD